MTNVYADLGQIFAHSNMAEPRVRLHAGDMIAGMGADHVVWGTDALWTGSPQWQIEALRRMEIPEELQKKYGLAPMGPADGPVKRAILGENNARLYGYSPKMRAAIPRRQGRVLQGPVRQARRRSHQPRLRLHPEGLIADRDRRARAERVPRGPSLLH